MRLLPAVALILLLGLLGAAPALADDIPPPVFPSGLPGPDDVPGGGGTPKSTPGPTYVVDPASPGTTLPAPGRTPTTKAPAARTPAKQPVTTPAPVGRKRATQVAAPIAAVSAPIEDGTDWWLIGAGAFLGLMLVEARRVTGSIARRP
ncbi:MAG: hypothetical protein J7518_00005 [Nocardioidaceae bacterium]|nr:hypothetical protein [Nocardioidaceae bacterium]